MNPNEFNDDEMPKLSIQQENEFKKLKLKLEHNAIFPESSKLNLPPEIEGMFLDSIFSFEKAHRSAKKISVYKKIGQPKFKQEADLSDDKLDKALDKITKLMLKNNLVLDVICDYENEERLIYKFITEELFFHEIDDFKIPGMNTCFVYEEFHPNHKYEIERTTEDFLELFFNKKNDRYHERFEKEFSNQQEINDFRSLFSKFKVKNFKITAIDFDEKSAKSTFKIDFWGKLSGSINKINFSGQGSLMFKIKHGFWIVKEIHLPIKN